MVGLRDRVEALSGTLEITSTPARGSSLAATLPIRDETGDDVPGEPALSALGMRGWNRTAFDVALRRGLEAKRV